MWALIRCPALWEFESETSAGGSREPSGPPCSVYNCVSFMDVRHNLESLLFCSHLEGTGPLLVCHSSHAMVPRTFLVRKKPWDSPEKGPRGAGKGNRERRWWGCRPGLSHTATWASRILPPSWLSVLSHCTERQVQPSRRCDAGCP